MVVVWLSRQLLNRRSLRKSTTMSLHHGNHRRRWKLLTSAWSITTWVEKRVIFAGGTFRASIAIHNSDFQNWCWVPCVRVFINADALSSTQHQKTIEMKQVVTIGLWTGCTVLSIMALISTNAAAQCRMRFTGDWREKGAAKLLTRLRL